MIPYVRLRHRPIRAALYYSQRLVPWQPARRLIAKTIAAVINLRHRTIRNAPLSALSRDGYAMLPRLLSEDAVDSIVDYLSPRHVILRDGTHIAGDRVPFGEPLANFPLRTVIGCPHVLKLANHPLLLELARGYLGCIPTISTIGIRWNYPTGQPADTQQYHRDTDDWRFFKFFTYLTDVAEDTGPHVYIRGSHRHSGRFRARPYTDHDILGHYKANAFVSVEGKRGTMFVADTYGIHRATPPIKRPRLMLEIGYSVLPLYALDYMPEKGRDLDIDPYVNRLIVEGSACRTPIGISSSCSGSSRRAS